MTKTWKTVREQAVMTGRLNEVRIEECKTQAIARVDAYRQMISDTALDEETEPGSVSIPSATRRRG